MSGLTSANRRSRELSRATRRLDRARTLGRDRIARSPSSTVSACTSFFSPRHPTGESASSAPLRVTAKLSIASVAMTKSRDDSRGTRASATLSEPRRRDPRVSGRTSTGATHPNLIEHLYGRIPASSMATGELGWWENLHISSSG